MVFGWLLNVLLGWFWTHSILQGVKAMQNPDGSCQGWGSGHPAASQFGVNLAWEHLGKSHFF